MHMHITYDCTRVQTQIVDVAVQKLITNKATSIITINQHLQSLQDRIKTLEAEKSEVVRASAKFACFLKHNAIAAYNDCMSDYLDHLIEVEKGQIKAGGDQRQLMGLVKMKSFYEQEVKLLEQAINDPKTNGRLHIPNGEEIKMLYAGLCRLQITGPMLNDAMNVAEAGDIRVMQYNEKRIQARRKQPHSWKH